MPGLRERVRAGQCVGHHVGEGHLLEGQPQGAGLDARQLEEVVHEGGQPVHLDPDLPVVPRGVVRDAVLERLGHRTQRGERGAEVVRHPRDEVAAAGLEQAFALAHLGVDHRPRLQRADPAAEQETEDQRDGAGCRAHDKGDVEVVGGQEHRPCRGHEAGDEGDHRGHRRDCRRCHDAALGKEQEHDPADDADGAGDRGRDQDDLGGRAHDGCSCATAVVCASHR